MSSRVPENLSLFPLKVVLFPGSMLPLHIFEERYRALIRESIDKSAEFGINFLDGAKMNPVGCSAIVKEVSKRYSDGRMDVVVEGKSRYTLKHLVESESPFFVGRVVFFDDKPEELDSVLRRRAIELYDKFVAVAFKGAVEPVKETVPDRLISFFLVQKSGLELRERQGLLRLTSENERLATLCRHLESTLPLLVSREKFDRIVVNDGYLTQM